MSVETVQPDVLGVPWVVPLDGAEGLLYRIPVVEDPIIQPGLPFLEAIPVKTEMPVPLFSSPNTTTDGSIPLRQEASMGEQYPLFVLLPNQHGKGSTETPISDPRALKAVGMNPDQPVGVQRWAMRSFWEAYHGEIAHLDDLHQTGKVSVEDYPSRMSDIIRAFGFDGPGDDLDGRVDIGTGMITDPRARVALTRQEDADRRAQLATWRARYRAGAFGNTTFSAVDAGINEDQMSQGEKQKQRKAEAAIREDAYMHRISPDGSPPVYAYKAIVDWRHEEAVENLQRAPEQRELAGMSQSARSARAGMPYLAVAQRIVEFGDGIAERVPPWVQPVVRGTARATATFAALAVAACSGGMQATFTPEVTHIPTPTSLEPTHISPPLIDAQATPESYAGLNPVELVAAPGVLPGAGGQEGSMAPVKMTDAFQKKLLAQGWAPVFDPATNYYALIGGTAEDKSVTCFSTTLEKIFGPRPELAIHPLRGVENGVAIFTDPSGTVAEQTVMNVSLVGAPEGATCVQAIGNDPQDPEYTLLKLLLVGPNGDVLGAIPTFSGDDRVVVQWSETEGPQLFVNGNKTWFVSNSGETVATVMPQRTETPMVLPAFTPEPSATPPPTETAPRSCLDQTPENQVVEQAVRQAGFATIEDMMNGFIDRYGLRSHLEQFGFGELEWTTTVGEKYPFLVNVKNASVLGHFSVTIDGGHANCLTFAYPIMEKDALGNNVLQVRIASAITDAMKDGEWSNLYVRNVRDGVGIGLTTFANENEYLSWIDRNIGNAMKIRIEVQVTPEGFAKGLSFNNNPGFPRSSIGDLARASYLARFSNNPTLIQEVVGHPSSPEPVDLAVALRSQIKEGVIPSEIGLFASLYVESK